MRRELPPLRAYVRTAYELRRLQARPDEEAIPALEEAIEERAGRHRDRLTVTERACAQRWDAWMEAQART